MSKALQVLTITNSYELCTATNPVSIAVPPQTLAELLAQIEPQGIGNFPALKSKLSLISELMQKHPHEITIQDVENIRPELRSRLVARHLAENSVRAYVDQIRFLLKCARRLGWRPTVSVPPAWVTVRQRCIEKSCTNLVTYLMSQRKSPAEVTPEDVECWIADRVRRGGALESSRRKKSTFWKVMIFCGYDQVSVKDRYGIPLREFPQGLKADVEELIRWKTAQFAPGRPKKAKIREPTAKIDIYAFCRLYGFVRNVLEYSEINSVSELITAEILNRFVEWAITERSHCGQSVIRVLGAIKAALAHPKYKMLAGPWFKDLIDSIAPESESELADKRAAKQIPYSSVETIPELIDAERKTMARRSKKELAIVVRDQLLMQWLIILPWRRRNLANCRVEGARPNLFKAKLDPFAAVSKTQWVEKALIADSEAEFWQCKFSDKETKSGKAVHILLPRPLIPLLEEYLDHRKQLLGKCESNYLFLNRAGAGMTEDQITSLVSELSLRHAGKAVSPHAFRHIVAYGWLKDHPGDYLTVSKLLFHNDIQTTIRTYASRFNESDGACGMENWFESRQKRTG